MKPLRNYTVSRQGREWIGDAVVRVLKEAGAPKEIEIVAVIPRMLSYFANCPERYEVTEVDLIVRDK